MMVIKNITILAVKNYELNKITHQIWRVTLLNYLFYIGGCHCISENSSGTPPPPIAILGLISELNKFFPIFPGRCPGLSWNFSYLAIKI